ncbi:MAG: siroheme decarboxylase subunit beta [Methanotrichaceae archaeon]
MTTDLIDDLDLRLIRAAQDGIELTSRPYRALGRELGLTEDEVIERIKALVENGVIRRFSATIGHRALGIVANAMIVWRVPLEKVDQVGQIMASFDQVTHCYERPIKADWPYNLYTMVHSENRERCKKIAAQISQKTGMKDYQIYFSEKEFKKTGARI